jgi:hypothetical protein
MPWSFHLFDFHKDLRKAGERTELNWHDFTLGIKWKMLVAHAKTQKLQKSQKWKHMKNLQNCKISKISNSIANPKFAPIPILSNYLCGRSAQHHAAGELSTFLLIENHRMD